MPAAKPASADLNTVIARITPDVLALLGDGVPRSCSGRVNAGPSALLVLREHA
jgi:hypothetical protein